MIVHIITKDVGMMDKVKVLLYGVGAVGRLIARNLLKKEGIKVVGAIDIAKDKIGKDLGEILGMSRNLGLKVSDNVTSLLENDRPDVAVHATSSFLRDTYEQIIPLVKASINVVSTCEELSFPSIAEPKLTKDLNILAKKHGATVLGTGINPGFLMDTLVITLTAACIEIERIEAARVMDASTRRLPFQKKIGAGLTVEEFKEKMKSGKITGHVGLEQSIAMIGDALKWNIEDIIVDEVKPVITKKPVRNRNFSIDVGGVTGLKQKAKGIVDNNEIIVLDFQAYIGAEEEYDKIMIKGIPNINSRIKPCVHGDKGTIAMVVNSIPRIINAQAGLFTMKDLPVPSGTPRDIRKYLL
jgi:4-hydroxy-tetrahydrodipicolinate reductase